MAVLARGWEVRGVWVSGSTDIPRALARRPTWFLELGQILAHTLPSLSLLKGTLLAWLFPHIGVVWPSRLDMCFASDSALWMILANSLEFGSKDWGQSVRVSILLPVLCPQWVEVPWWPCRKAWMVEGRKQVCNFQGHGPPWTSDTVLNLQITINIPFWQDLDYNPVTWWWWKFLFLLAPSPSKSPGKHSILCTHEGSDSKSSEKLINLSWVTWDFPTLASTLKSQVTPVLAHQHSWSASVTCSQWSLGHMVISRVVRELERLAFS